MEFRNRTEAKRAEQEHKRRAGLWGAWGATHLTDGARLAAEEHFAEAAKEKEKAARIRALLKGLPE